MKRRSFYPEVILAMLAAGLLTASCSQFFDDYQYFNKNNNDDIGGNSGNSGESGLPLPEGGNAEEPESPIYIENTVWINTENGTQGEGYENLNAALNWLKNNAVNNGNYIILLGTDENLSPQTLNYGSSDKVVSITLISADNNEKQITLASSGILFNVGANVTLTLNEGITLKGRRENKPDALVYIQKNGTLIMNNGSAVKDNASGEFGAVIVEGAFVMNGGSITGNSKKFSFHEGGGVSIIDGVFTMNGGSISGNSADMGGGVGLCSETGKNPVFIMNGGSISGNYADWGGGVHISEGGKFSMTGGSISDNAAHAGGGVCLFGTVWAPGEFIMTGGKISNNIAELNGGGIFSSEDISKEKFVIGGNAVISGNSLKDNPFAWNGYGGGIYCAGSVTLKDNCVIENNTAKGGAGVYLTMHYGSTLEQAFVMTGGTIRSNTAQNFGGGVAIKVTNPYIQFHKTGGTIYGRNGNADANIVLNSPSIEEPTPPVTTKPKPNEDDQGENDNSQGNNNNQGENGGNKKPGTPPAGGNNNTVLPGNGNAVAIVEFDAANIFSGIILRKDNTTGSNDPLSSTADKSAGSWD